MDAHLAALNQTHLAPWDLAFDRTLPPAYYAATAKMHKRPPSMRFLACSQSCPSTTISHLVTAVLRATTAEFTQLWATRLPSFPPWLCLSSNAIRPLVHRYNATARPYASLHRPQAFDFTRLYTNIPHQDLRDTLRSLLTAALQHQHAPDGPAAPNAAPSIIRVNQNTTRPAADSTAFSVAFVARAPGRLRRRGPTLSRYFTVDEFIDNIFQPLLDSTYIAFGPLLVHQVLGIPMGISAAPFIANLFLAWFEYEFLLQHPRNHPRAAVGPLSSAQQYRQAAILDAFRFTIRYLDDLLSLDNPHLASLLSRADLLEGLHGLYPPALRLEPQSHPHLDRAGSAIPFLDVLIIMEERGQQAWCRTELYDKREQPAFHGIPLSRFIWEHSSVNDSSRRSIFVGQFHRLRKQITTFHNFADEIGAVMFSLSRRGYHLRFLHRQLHRLWRQHPHAFSCERHTHPASTLFNRVRQRLRSLQAHD
jgi:hypothetical protein